MVDVDRRTSLGLTPSHVAGLRRLSTRASSKAHSSTTARVAGLHSFAPLASSLASSLTSSGVPLSPGLSEPEMARIEAEFAFTFPPDLRALLSLSLPKGAGFPNWRGPLPSSLRPSLDLPIAAVSLQIARTSFWPRSWGPRPSDPTAALLRARASLRRAPLLIPIFHRCYLPSLPPLAGNPVFFVDDHQITLCGLDLADFFSRFLRSASAGPHHHHRSVSLPLDLPKVNPRWVEFWSDAAACDRKRRSSSSTSDPERFVEIRMVKPPPEWLREYLDRIGSVLKNGGWGETEVTEMVEVTAASASEMVDLAVDGQAVLDSLLLKADRCSDSLRRAGWSSEEVSDVLGFDFRLERKGKKRPEVKLPAEIRIKIGKLAEAVARS